MHISFRKEFAEHQHMVDILSKKMKIKNLERNKEKIK